VVRRTRITLTTHHCRKYHTHILHFDGEGGWSYESMNDRCLTDRLSLEDEKKNIETRLQETPQMKQRLMEICAVLHFIISIHINECKNAHFTDAW
jgi:hypothetical protein